MGSGCSRLLPVGRARRIRSRLRFFHRRPSPVRSSAIDGARFTRGRDAKATTLWRRRIGSCFRAAQPRNRRGTGRLTIVVDRSCLQARPRIGRFPDKARGARRGLTSRALTRPTGWALLRSTDATLDKGGPRPEAERTEGRWSRAGLIATLVFLALATLCNAIGYRTLVRAQERLALSLAHPSRPGPGPAGQPYRPGFGGPTEAAKRL